MSPPHPAPLRSTPLGPAPRAHTPPTPPSAPRLALRKKSLYRAQLRTQRDSPAHVAVKVDVLRDTRVGAIMRMISVSGVPVPSRALSVRVDADLRTAAETLLTHKLREIQVVDASGTVVGLLDEADISRFYLKAADASAAAP